MNRQTPLPRADRADDALRVIEIRTGFLDRVPSSVLFASGLTKVLCAATLEEGVPPFLEGSGRGWATAEYDLLPVSTVPRKNRERTGKLSGRTQEIQRLIGRCVRAVLDLEALDGWTLRLDCDVLQADGGTRTAAINGAWVAAALAVGAEIVAGRFARNPIVHQVSAISVGRIGGRNLLDLDQAEDNSADVDLNVAMLDGGEIVEIQGTAEGAPFSRADLDALVDLAEKGIREVRAAQRRAVAGGTPASRAADRRS